MKAKELEQTPRHFGPVAIRVLAMVRNQSALWLRERLRLALSRSAWSRLAA